MTISLSQLIGLFLIVAGFILALCKRNAFVTIAFIFAGLITCLFPKAGGLWLKFMGLEATVTSQVSDTTEDIAAQIAPIRFEINKLQEAFEQQRKPEKSPISASAPDSGNAGAADPSTKSDPTKVSSENSQYKVLVFYKDAREQDATKIVKGLVKAGFQASSLPTSFDEAPQLTANGTISVVPTERGNKVSKAVENAVVSQGLEGVTLWGPYALRKGDVQVFLY